MTDLACTCTPNQLCAYCAARGYTNALAGFAARIYPGTVVKNWDSARDGCAWCYDIDTDPADPERELCAHHLAEYEGLSMLEMERRDAIEASELADMRD